MGVSSSVQLMFGSSLIFPNIRYFLFLCQILMFASVSRGVSAFIKNKTTMTKDLALSWR